MIPKEIALSKLICVPEKEWIVILAKCRKHVKTRIRCKTLFGAHSLKNLGMPAEQYYFEKAVEKLYAPLSGWVWQFEKFTLLEQVIRIIDSLISEEVRKAGTAKAKMLDIIYTDDGLFLENFDDGMSIEEIKEGEQRIQDLMNQVSEAIKGDDKLEMLYICLLDGKNYDEITIEMALENKNKLYKLVERLKEKVQKHIISIKNSNEAES